MGDDVQLGVARLALAELRFSHLHPRHGGIAGGGEPVDVGLGDEPAVDELERTIEIRLRQLGGGPRDLDVRGDAGGLLSSRTERPITARTSPAFTQSPASTPTRTTRPPSPTTPTAISRRAASVPVALIWP